MEKEEVLKINKENIDRQQRIDFFSNIDEKDLYEYVIPKLKQYAARQKHICENRLIYLKRSLVDLDNCRRQLLEENPELRKPRKPRPVKVRPPVIIKTIEEIDLFAEDRTQDRIDTPAEPKPQ